MTKQAKNFADSWRERRVQELEAFKKYVHDRLDAMGVPHSDPESEHDKAGCRIGGRLDIVEKALAKIGVARADQEGREA